MYIWQRNLCLFKPSQNFRTARLNNILFQFQSVSQLGHALCASRLQECSLVHVYWPRELCALLRDDVVLVDSPGVDVTPNLDEWIDKYCLDADVFVLVANAESTLMVTVSYFGFRLSNKITRCKLGHKSSERDSDISLSVALT